jgi:hypothetical protein
MGVWGKLLILQLNMVKNYPAPAQAGIQFCSARTKRNWAPAYAGAGKFIILCARSVNTIKDLLLEYILPESARLAMTFTIYQAETI